MLDNVAKIIFSEKCYEQFIKNSNDGNEQCLRQGAITVLGVVVMFVSVFMKLPQLLKIVKNRSGEGINMKTMFTELFVLTASSSYAYSNGYPFSAWGEVMFLALQQCGLVSLLLLYGSSAKRMLLFVACYASVVATVAARLVPLQALLVVQACNLPLMLSGKLFQFSTNYRNGSTGQLSALTTGLTVLVCALRVFTSAVATGDKLIVLTFSTSTLGNALILGQMAWYWNADKDRKKIA